MKEDWPSTIDYLNEKLFIRASRNQFDKIQTIHKFGYNGSVGTSDETIWESGGLYSWPSSASAMTVSSGDANDTSAGSGANTVTIRGLDSDYNSFNETIVMDGQNPVTTSTSIIRVYRVQVLTAGSSNVNEGNIYVGTGTVTSGVPDNIYSYVAADKGQTLQSFYTVPAGWTAFLKSYYLTAPQGKTVDFKVFERLFGGAWNIKDQISIYQTTFNYEEPSPAEIAEKTDIEFRAAGSAGTTAVTAIFNLILIKND